MKNGKEIIYNEFISNSISIGEKHIRLGENNKVSGWAHWIRRSSTFGYITHKKIDLCNSHGLENLTDKIKV